MVMIVRFSTLFAVVVITVKAGLVVAKVDDLHFFTPVEKMLSAQGGD